ncbi:1-(5-phosphoribosyl)-5-[(5-phosphoribosylamino)methylideneamino]imidazole-4-carboxamide isomerase [Candidatus Berkiella aquae]|uniref:1-(5-phosphoribosyl)-5-[(5-phosphoribosylamino)methylideneamino] imidazole-4-carboxamide isomerase n=1 Tax=Candidatus Berkiella aquae TaxID=295108 RepID=A0A0Q9YMB2_9GAMM|nr:1-(5-phosphoribosyl)-5-[(5-phosphoribosylamino)methylideneamino]imidazole-4-carboxamide isomerase [Candidatus Berkiella aquae]MCS5710409.1 1-(5-phosphoribosyl)-5-[(5-phosphoribosylamino)methylideneamino]imidazole-4-carboxamide isomerase [Candidatus Berkiella aquae]
MKVIPAIDIRFGKCVRLFQGDFNQITEYDVTPLAMAKQYEAGGATDIHIVDLHGAKDAMMTSTSMIAEIASQCNLQIQMGGGIRQFEQVETLLKQGVSRVVIGSLAVKEPKKITKWIKKLGPESIVLALDVKLDELGQPGLVTAGWLQNEKMTLWQLLDEYESSGLQTVLCTDVSRDGTLSSPNFAFYKECVERFPQINWQTSGGVSTLQDLIKLKQMNVYSAIVGKAFYEKCFTVKEAMQVVESC